MKFFSNLRFRWKRYVAIKTAIRAHEADGRRYLVLNLNGTPTVVNKGQIIGMLKAGYFKSGTTYQKIKSIALFVTK